MKTKDGIAAKELVGGLVQCGAIWGVAEYLTADGWFGVRQVGGRLDEVRAEWCVADPT